MRDERLEAPEDRNSDALGFTLIELMIVVAIIAIIASVAVPQLMASRHTANERVVVGVLRSITSAQAEFQNQIVVDMDRNGVGEFGTLGEMAGLRPLRDASGRITPNVVSFSLGDIDVGGRARRNGYYFMVYLPDAAGIGQPETTAGIANIDSMLATYYWSCVAWPVEHGVTANASYFTNQGGEILKTRAPYSGAMNGPPAGAALAGTATPQHMNSNDLARNGTGADGNTWLPVQ